MHSRIIFEQQAQQRIQSEFYDLTRSKGEDYIYFSKKYNIYMRKRITTPRDYKEHFHHRAKEAQDSRQFRRAALLRAQSSIPHHKDHMDEFTAFHIFETLIDWGTIRQMNVQDISLSFMIRRRDNSKKNITFVIPCYYPYTPPILFINGTPFRSIKRDDDIKVQLVGWRWHHGINQRRAPFITQSALTTEWSPAYGIEQCVQLVEPLLDEIPLKTTNRLSPRQN